MKIAEVETILVSPHCPYGPVLTAALLQLDACIHNFLIQEYCSLGESVLKETFKFKDGYIEIPVKLGLGIEIDEKAIAKRLYKPHGELS